MNRCILLAIMILMLPACANTTLSPRASNASDEKQTTYDEGYYTAPGDDQFINLIR